MGIISKNMDFRREERAIRSQVQLGQRCADCLRRFNQGERKHFKTESGSVICQRCASKESLSPFRGEEEAAGPGAVDETTSPSR